MVRLIFILFFILVLLSNCKPKENKVSKPLIPSKFNYLLPFINQYADSIRSIMAETNAPGVAIAIVKEDEIIFLKGFGVKEYGTSDSVDIHTVFRLGSVSKGFAPVLTGLLVENKLLSWNDKIIKHIPDFKLKDSNSTQEVTIQNILSHTSGFPMHAFTNHIEDGRDYKYLRNLLSTVDIISKPGQIYSYQNVAYSVIGEVCETVTGITYADLLKTKIFEPLEMYDASDSYDSIILVKNLALPHVVRGNTYFCTKITPEYYNFVPAAGVNVSIDDMSKWLLMLLGNNKDFISDTTLKEIFRPLVSTRNYMRKHQMVKKMMYAKGWRVVDFSGDTILYHGGFVKGYRAEIGLFEKDKIGIAVLCNFPGKLPNNCIPLFYEMYFNFINQKKE